MMGTPRTKVDSIPGKSHQMRRSSAANVFQKRKQDMAKLPGLSFKYCFIVFVLDLPISNEPCTWIHRIDGLVKLFSS